MTRCDKIQSSSHRAQGQGLWKVRMTEWSLTSKRNHFPYKPSKLQANKMEIWTWNESGSKIKRKINHTKINLLEHEKKKEAQCIQQTQLTKADFSWQLEVADAFWREFRFPGWYRAPSQNSDMYISSELSKAYCQFSSWTNCNGETKDDSFLTSILSVPAAGC